MIISVSLNPAVDRAIVVDSVNVDGVNRVVSTRVDAGGKGINVSKMVKVLGGDTLATGIVGGSTGQFIQTQLTQMGIAHDFVTRKELTRTNLKINDSLRHTTTEFNEPGEAVTEELLAQVWEKIAANAKQGDAVVISGTNPPGMAVDVLADWVRKLKAMGVFVALDTVGEAMKLGIKEQPNVIKPNIHELSDIVGMPLHYHRDIIGVARQMVQQGVEFVVVSMGAEGALFVTKEHILFGKSANVQVCSTVGSGDAMLASILCSWQQGRTLEETARWSLATGCANVMCQGSQTPNLAQIEALYREISVEQIV